MGQPLPLRPDDDALALRALARRAKEAAQSRRLLALAAIEAGASRTEAARLGSVTLQIIRDWLLRFNAPLPAGLIDRKAPAPRPRLSDRHRAALAAAIEAGPVPAIHGVVRWWLCDLCQWL
jgi:transposase